jgi:HTH-type transcriptional regulator/antitoxin HigA
MTVTPIHIIRTEADYGSALAEFERYFDDEPEPGSAEGDRFELLGLVLHDYEEKHWPIERVAPVEILKFSMEQNDRSQADLAALLGSRSRASEILTGKRELTLDQIRKINKAWKIPASLLVGELEDA